jgi:hypothetical protein
VKDTFKKSLRQVSLFGKVNVGAEMFFIGSVVKLRM